MIAIHLKFILLCLTTEYRVLIEHQYCPVRPALAVSPACRKPGNTAADDDDVRTLPGIGSGAQRLVEFLIANSRMCGVDHFVSVAVGAGIITNSTGTRPIGPKPCHRSANRLRLGATDRGWRCHSE